MSSSDTTRPAWLQAFDHLKSPTESSSEYRLYYDDQGHVVSYSMEDLPGRYILVDRQTYAQGRYDIRIVNGSIVVPKKSRYGKIKPAESGVACHSTNAMIVDPTGQKFWRLENYED